jgi:hypothetical protein
MTLKITHERIAIGYNRNVCNMTLGEKMQDFREPDLKLRHVSDNMAQRLKSALKS